MGKLSGKRFPRAASSSQGNVCFYCSIVFFVTLFFSLTFLSLSRKAFLHYGSSYVLLVPLGFLVNPLHAEETRRNVQNELRGVIVLVENLNKLCVASTVE